MALEGAVGVTNFNGEVSICGCGQRAAQLHHVVYRQHIPSITASVALARMRDERNLVPVAFHCHGAHHGRSKPFSLDALPDSVFPFALEVLGAGAAYEYLRRRYAGEDSRLDALLEDVAA